MTHPSLVWFCDRVLTPLTKTQLKHTEICRSLSQRYFVRKEYGAGSSRSDMANRSEVALGLVLFGQNNKKIQFELEVENVTL